MDMTTFQSFISTLITALSVFYTSENQAISLDWINGKKDNFLNWDMTQLRL